MSKVLSASCAAGIVTCEGVPVPGVTILSEGVGSSSGVLILQGSSKYYVAKTSPDLASIIPDICTILTALDSALGSTQTAAIAALLLKASGLK